MGDRQNSVMRAGPTADCYCAVLYDSEEMDRDDGFVVLQPGEMNKIKKIDGVKWGRKTSWVEASVGNFILADA